MTKDVCICLLTAHRLDYATITLEAVLKNAVPLDRVRLHIASDGDDEDYLKSLTYVAREVKGCEDLEITTSNSGGRGYGANWNAATQIIHNVGGPGELVRYVLPLEDDWRLERTLDLNDLIEVLDSTRAPEWAGNDELPMLGCIRLGYLGFNHQLRGYLENRGKHQVIRFDHTSLEQHIFAGHPRLETVAFERVVGPWPEDLNPGATELAVCARLAARTAVAWPLDLIHTSGDLFAHIGSIKSY